MMIAPEYTLEELACRPKCNLRTFLAISIETSIATFVVQQSVLREYMQFSAPAVKVAKTSAS